MRAVAHGGDEVCSRLRRDGAWTPLLVVSTPRVGSNLLLDYLRCLPGVSMRGEVLHPRTTGGLRPGRSRAAVLHHLHRSLVVQPGRVRGLKLPLGHLQQHGLDLPDVDAALPGARWVVLYRESLPDQYVSWRLARATAAWTSHTPQRADVPRPHLRAEEFRDWATAVRDRYDEVRALGWDDRWEWVSYEELVADPAGVVGERLRSLIGVPPGRLATGLRKQASRPLDQRVQGDEALTRAFAEQSARLSYAGTGRRAG